MDTNFPGMLDTGSPRSLIKNSLVQKFRIKINPPQKGQPTFLYNASDNRMPVLGYINLKFHIDGLKFCQNFMVVEDLSVLCILGRDFMAVAHCQINFIQKTVTLCDEMLTVNILRDFKSTKNLALMAKTVQIDPYSECLAPVILKHIAPTKQRQFLVDPLPPLYRQKYSVGNALITQTDDDHFFIPVKNFSSKK